jgi:SAM-dependent methyltransferase
MGIDKDVAKFLLSARERGVDFKKSLMLGNQQFQFFNYDYTHLADAFNLKNFTRIKTSTEFLQFLGAEEISAMDFSDYEGAAILHDLNKPIGDDLKEKFTFVLDGGTTEHVFNFPTALANAMEMVETGGHLVIITGGNNFLGHGFYQFSPELFYRALSRENGFEVKRLIAAEVGGSWYEVADPKTIKSRVELINDQPVYLMVLARKIESRPLFTAAPQQSDYVEMWNGEAGNQSNEQPNKLKTILKKNELLRETLIGIKQKQKEGLIRKQRSFANEKAFKLVDK